MNPSVKKSTVSILRVNVFYTNSHLFFHEFPLKGILEYFTERD
jgi:hypothetical protein